MDLQIPTPKHITMKLKENNEMKRSFQNERKKMKRNIKYSSLEIGMAADFSIAIMKSLREWDNPFTAVRKKDFYSKIPSPSKISINYDHVINTHKSPSTFSAHAFFLKNLLEIVLHQE
jgi:hypothetical protein